MEQKILLTGSTGFIGKQLVTSFQEQGLSVTTVTRKEISSSTIPNFVVGYINGQTDYTAALKDIDCVVHAAARAHVLNETSNNPLALFQEINVEGTLNLAKQAIAADVKRFVFLSTIGVYGDQQKKTFTENSLLQPSNDYARSKLEAEEKLIELTKSSNMELVIIRPPLVYGAHAPGNFGKLFNLISKSVPLPFGLIKNKRSMVYVGNLIDFIITCTEHPAAANETFVISDNDDVSLLRLISLLRKALGKKKLLVPVPAFLFRCAGKVLNKQKMIEQLVGDLQIDCSKAQELLGWQPPYTFEQGISKTVEAYLKTTSSNQTS